MSHPFGVGEHVGAATFTGVGSVVTSQVFSDSHTYTHRQTDRQTESKRARYEQTTKLRVTSRKGTGKQPSR